MNEKVMPQKIDAEQSVLGAMFLSKTALEKAVESLNKDMFYLDAHKKIFEVMKNLDDKKVPIDITTVTNELEEKKLLNQIGGVAYLTEIVNVVPTAANVDQYIKIIEDKYLRRLEAMMIVLDKEKIFILSGTGDVVEPEDGKIAAIGSGGNYALSAARALDRFGKGDMEPRDLVLESLKIAGELCIYTNQNIKILEL